MASPLETVAAEIAAGKTDFGPAKPAPFSPNIPDDLLSSDRQPVSLLLLGELHDVFQCAVDNSKIIADFMEPTPAESILFASEGRQPHPCLFIFKDVFGKVQKITEYDSSAIPPDEMALMIVLDHAPLTMISEGNPFLHPANGKPLGITYFMENFNRGPKPFLEAAGIAKQWTTLIGTAFKKDAETFQSQSKVFFNDLVAAFEKVQAKRPNPRIPPFLEELREYAETLSNESRSKVETIVNETRDTDFAIKILRKVVSTRSIKKVVVIMGDIHFQRMKAIFSRIPFVQFDQRSKAHLPQYNGGRSKKTRRQRVTKGRRRLNASSTKRFR